ncbi:double-stranded DNA repair protein Mre11 [Methanosarcina sp. 1.H.T.1A.1]|uniref:metallophosphoesterase family protein n=1 Tax=Methanosarcina sp. 1.H.T.1A.1 TaxID=1483602 RepID=UPI0006223B6C|nr:exonuclease SbcCD subunit D [Methanosarcina sp. 1.H.T.1A.1]KKH91819.1 double-stranded DNA repair protein Mre11 [Methanosarcina sp. 1.H.T.1A.1]
MVQETRILHTADTHLGYRQYHSEVRRQDFFKAFEVVIQDAVDMQVDAVVHAGDLFDSRNPTLEDLLETMNLLFRLKAANIPFFGIVGNHESKQTTQWLDLFEEMGLAVRLGKTPQLVGDTAIYGIDSVPKSKIPLYDYSGFEVPESLPENCRNLLVMHQTVQPFPYADWDCAETLANLPFKVDAILLGDYHKYEKIKVGETETWATYPGSTERNSASENDPRSYNIITLSGEGLEISRRTIPTRNFLFIPAKLDGEEKPYEQIYSAVNEHLEELPDSVVFLDISGDSGPVLSFSEIEEYLLSKGVLVARVKDLRIKEALLDEVVKVAFSDPDHAVAEEINRLSLNDGGLIVDEIIRNPGVSRSRVDEETESRLSGLIEALDFKDPNFRIEIPVSPVIPVSSASPVSPVRIGEPEEFKPGGAAEPVENPESAGGAEFAAAIAEKSKFLRAFARIESSESLNNSFEDSDESPESLDKVCESPVEGHELPHVPVICGNTESLESAGSCENAESVGASVEIETPNTAANSLAEAPFPSEISQETPGTPVEIPPVIPSEGGKRAELGIDAGYKTEAEDAEAGKLPGSGRETSPEKDGEGKTEKPADEKPADEKFPDEKPAQAPDRAGKPVKQSQKKGKEKPAVPKQYNLGDYL